MAVLLRALWHYRSYILGSVKREFQLKYRNSMLGALWMILNPLAMITVYTLIFSQIMQARLPGVSSVFAYSIYLCAGILTWGLFAEIITRSQNVFLEHANLIKKVSFPRMTLPLIIVLNALLNFFIIFGLFTFFLVITDTFPGWSYLVVFPVLMIQILFAVGLGITIGVLNVFFRDVGQLFGILMQFWFWLTPIVYPAGIVPDSIAVIFDYNPMYPFISAYQTILVKGDLPPWQGLFLMILLSSALCVFALRLFRKRAGEMVDEL